MKSMTSILPLAFTLMLANSAFGQNVKVTPIEFTTSACNGDFETIYANNYKEIRTYEKIRVKAICASEADIGTPKFINYWTIVNESCASGTEEFPVSRNKLGLYPEFDCKDASEIAAKYKVLSQEKLQVLSAARKEIISRRESALKSLQAEATKGEIQARRTLWLNKLGLLSIRPSNVADAVDVVQDTRDLARDDELYVYRTLSTAFEKASEGNTPADRNKFWLARSLFQRLALDGSSATFIMKSLQIELSYLNKCFTDKTTFDIRSCPVSFNQNGGSGIIEAGKKHSDPKARNAASEADKALKAAYDRLSPGKNYGDIAAAIANMVISLNGKSNPEDIQRQVREIENMNAQSRASHCQALKIFDPGTRSIYRAIGTC